MGYTMGANQDNIQKLAEDLTDGGTTIDGQIEGIINTATKDEPTVWSGAGFEMYVSGINSYSTALKTFPQAINAFSTAFSTIATKAGELTENVEQALNEIE